MLVPCIDRFLTTRQSAKFRISVLIKEVNGDRSQLFCFVRTKQGDRYLTSRK